MPRRLRLAGRCRVRRRRLRPLVQAGDVGAAARHDLHQALADQHLHRFGRRAARHAMLLHQGRVRGQRTVRFQLTALDGRPQDRGQLHVDRRAGQVSPGYMKALSHVRAEEDAHSITPAEAAAERVELLERHLELCQQARLDHLGGQP